MCPRPPSNHRPKIPHPSSPRNPPNLSAAICCCRARSQKTATTASGGSGPQPPANECARKPATDRPAQRRVLTNSHQKIILQKPTVADGSRAIRPHDESIRIPSSRCQLRSDRRENLWRSCVPPEEDLGPAARDFQ